MKMMTLVHIKHNSIPLLRIENDYCRAVVSLHGAQVLQFYSKTQNKDLLWLSKIAQYETGKAIRGGVPLCFPWFGGHPTDSTLPAHGFARNTVWQLKNISQDSLGDHILLELTDSQATRQLWDYAFKLEMLIHCGEQLQLEFILNNLDSQDFEFTFAWHSYFNANIEQTSILGLENTTYIDQLDGNQVKIQTEKAIEFLKELDRIYPKTSSQFILKQNARESIHIQSSATSAVIWNPWIKKTKRLVDVEDSAWKDFVCVETGQIASESVELLSGENVAYQLSIA